MSKHLRMVVSDYLATGEGLIVSVMITNHGSFPDGLREKFEDHFGSFFASGAEEIKQEEDSKRWNSYMRYVPEVVTTPKEGCSMSWFGQFRINCS